MSSLGNTPEIVAGVTEIIVNTINEHNLAEQGASILVAVSGGADSVCLLDVLNRIKKSNGFKIYAAHLNHGIRGAEADRDEAFVKKLCASMGVKCFSERADVPRIAAQMNLTEEEAGRNVRYEYFSRLCAENKIDLVATAHNKNDQAETVLMRIMRGSGLAGLRGIKYKREDGVIRPLLDVTRAEIEEYLEASGIEYITDSTNNDDSYTRNRVRHSLLPLLERDFNPSIVSALSNMAKNLEDDGAFIDGYAERLYERVRAPLRSGKFKGLHIASLKVVNSKSIMSRLISLCAKDAMGKDYVLEKKHFEAVFALMESEGVSSIDLPDGLRVTARYGWLEFSDKKSAEFDKKLNSCNNDEFSVAVGINKLYNIEEAGVSISLAVMNSEAYAPAEGDMCLDLDKLGVNAESDSDLRFVVRNRREGDKVAVYKNGNTKKLKRLFIDKKIPAEERWRVPVLCKTDGEIIAVLGVRVNEKYKVTRRSENLLVAHYEYYED